MNNIVKFRLEETAQKLKKEGYSDQRIADHLSDHTDHKISRGSVVRYFIENDELAKQIAEKSSIIAIKTINGKLDAAHVFLENVTLIDAAIKEAWNDHSWNAVSKLFAERRLNAEAAARATGEIPSDKTSLNILNIQNNAFREAKFSHDEILRLRQIVTGES